ncbi:MAG: hypothetical protein RJQ14_04930 [Marinoscillum sp.]
MTKLICCFLVIVISSLAAPLIAQFKEIPPAKEINSISAAGYGSFGLGIGLPYGGLGGQFGYNVSDRFNSFLGVGYNFVELGFNIGVAYDFAILNRTSFYVSGMGGYNAVTLIQGLEEYNETFFGPSFGIGMKFNGKKREGNFWQFGLVVPFKSASYHERVRKIKDDPRIDTFTEANPVLISVGYHMGF